MIYEYKCVAAPKELIVDKSSSAEKAINSFANFINNEAMNGWEFYSMEELSTSESQGCLGSLFGGKPIVTVHNMLIFRRVKNDGVKNMREATEELKMYKDQLDLGLITEEDYIYYKRKLFPNSIR